MFVSLRLLRSKKSIPFTVIVSAKTYKRAVDRNKLKRRVRAIVRSAKKPLKKPLALVMKKGALEIPYSELKEAIENQL